MTASACSGTSEKSPRYAHYIMRAFIALPLLPLAAACSSGGSGGSTPTPTPANAAPVFTSAANATVLENVAAAYQATATDPNGDPLTFSIAGGPDAARFTITTAGALSFNPAPNFEAPTDAGADNVYDVQLRVSDGALSATRDVSINVTNSREGIQVRRVGTGFNQPVFVAPVNGDPRVLVIEKGGGVWYLDPTTGTKTLETTIGNISTDGERGLLGIAPRPNFLLTRQAYVYCTAPDGTIEIRLYTIGTLPYTVVLSIPHPGFNNHNGGWIAFGPDGYLYAATGDGGGTGDPGNNAQNPNSRLGKILRMNEGIASVTPAPGNPYIGGGGDPYVFALGLRNPFRNSFALDGRLYIGDVGQGAIEEINVVRPDQPGLNFGWPFLEGTQPYRGTAPAGLTAPVSQYGHGTGPTQGASIIGGYAFTATSPVLPGLYVFGDFVSGNIWTVPAASLVQGSLFPAGSYERRNADFTPDVGTIDQLVSFGRDNSGYLYLIDLDGEIFRVLVN
ncbi:PQQ-dependent sugar dehydrogenase [Sphingomonas sp. AOB5]|uniref:PQQ-dependent sugar dehydrogenase n=1 Tax=Sphingomonas sp. AOB5 TaxID=3034017 RepID=UPI0023F71972|nr:PQQ-dependent sugar dehydrogenase [Sphingomonas sp. AOB5]MDF7774964.1 PQQ-dependent sugar dehydrogenase [Sphingomonas sp. AOB5]